MKKTTIILAGLFALSMLLAGCGHLDGNNPMGVTGGGSNGYGSLGGSIGAGGGGGGQIDQELVGVWRADSQNGYELLTINDNGTFSDLVYENGSLVGAIAGTYSLSGNIITVNFEGQTETAEYAVSGNTLTLNRGGIITTYHRVS